MREVEELTMPGDAAIVAVALWIAGYAGPIEGRRTRCKPQGEVKD